MLTWKIEYLNVLASMRICTRPGKVPGIFVKIFNQLSGIR